MLQEKLIDFDTAVLAKEKGFDTPTFKFYYLNDKKGWHKKGDLDEGFDHEVWGNNTNLNWNSLNILPFKPFSSCVSAPTQSLLQKWLREIHFILVEPIYNTNYNYFDLVIFNGSSHLSHHFKAFNSYEEALEEGLQKALKLI